MSNCHCDDEPDGYHEGQDECARCGQLFDCWSRWGNDHTHCGPCRKRLRDAQTATKATAPTLFRVSGFADTEAEAREIAGDVPVCSLSDPCSHGDTENETWVHSGEIDGQPEIVRVEQEEE